MVIQKKKLRSEESPWSSIPADILREILSRISWSYHPSFSLVCKHWHSVVSPFYPAWITPVLLHTEKVGSDRMCYYSPYFNKNFEVEYELQTSYAKICCATGGILTLSSDGELTVANLVTRAYRKLPLFYMRFFDYNIYDYGEIFGISLPHRFVEGVAESVLFGTIMHCIGKFWHFTGHQDDFPFFIPSSISNPVFHGELLYCLEENGKLAVYDPKEWQEAEGWKVLPKPESFGNLACHECYLVDSEEKLMAILIGHEGMPIHVLMLNEKVMEWEKVERLDGYAIFTGTLTTVCKKTTMTSMGNKVFLPRFYSWPETIKVDLVSSNGELAFVPKSLPSETKEATKDSEENIWCYELGQDTHREFWDTERTDYSIWVDFSTDEHTYDFNFPEHPDEFTIVSPDEVENAE